MKIDINVEFDTDKETDLALIEDVLYYIQDIKDMLETKQQKQQVQKNNRSGKRQQ